MQIKSKTEIYEYDLSLSLGAELIADLMPREFYVAIKFTDNKFVSVDFDFKKPYTFEQWEILRQIANLIKGLQREHDIKRRGRL